MNAVRGFMFEAAKRGVELCLNGDDIYALGGSKNMPPKALSFIRDNKAEIVSILRHKTKPIPLPKSVHACLDFLRRTKFEKPLTPKLERWLATDRSIAKYEKQGVI